MNKSLSKFLQIAIPLGLGVFLTYYMYTRFSPEELEEVKEHFRNADYWIVGLSVFLSMLSHLFRAYRWNFLLEPLGYKPTLLNNYMAVSVAYFMNIFIPKSGEVSRGVVINRYEKVPFDKAFGTIISERVVDLVLLFAFTVVAFILQFDALYAYMSEIVEPSKLYPILGAGVVFVLLVVLFLKYSRSRIRQKVIQFLIGLKEGLLSVFKMKRKWSFVFYTLVIWTLYISAFYVATFALKETSGIPLGTVIISFVVGSFAFAFTNSGFGAYPISVAGILAVFSIPETAGAAFGWIVWISHIAMIIFFGVLSFIFLPIYNRNRKQPSEDLPSEA